MERILAAALQYLATVGFRVDMLLHDNVDTYLPKVFLNQLKVFADTYLNDQGLCFLHSIITVNSQLFNQATTFKSFQVRSMCWKMERKSI